MLKGSPSGGGYLVNGGLTVGWKVYCIKVYFMYSITVVSVEVCTVATVLLKGFLCWTEDILTLYVCVNDVMYY